MDRSVEILAIVWFGVLGLSHITQPRAWVEFFTMLRSKGEAGVIIAFHNVWAGIPAVLTIVGWGLLIKSLLRLCLPKQGLKLMARVSVERCWEFQMAGGAFVILAGLLGYGVYAG